MSIKLVVYDDVLLSDTLVLWAEHLSEKAARSEAVYKKKVMKRRGRNHKHNFSNKYNRKGQQKAYKKEWHRAVRQMKRWSDDKRVSTTRSELNWGGL